MSNKPRTVEQLAQTGEVNEARRIIRRRRPTGVVVVEVNLTTPDHQRSFRRVRR